MAWTVARSRGSDTQKAVPTADGMAAALGVGMNPYFYATDPVSGSVAKFPATGIGTLSNAVVAEEE